MSDDNNTPSRPTTVAERSTIECFGYPYVFALSVIEGFNPAVYHRLTAEETSLGRDEEMDFAIDDPGVSSEHARIFVRGNTVEIMDLNSRNGVFLNGRRLVPKVRQRLRHLDEIRIGSSRLLFTSNRFTVAPHAGASATGSSGGADKVIPAELDNCSDEEPPVFPDEASLDKDLPEE